MRHSIEMMLMIGKNSVDLVNYFWARVWNPPYDLAAIDRLVTEDFIITSAGKDICSRTAFKDWIANFQSKIDALRLIPIETFSNEDGSRVVSRWIMKGKNEGMLGTKPDGKNILLTGISIWAISEGKLAHNWVERSAFEVHQQLISS